MPAARDKSKLYEFTLPNGSKGSLPKFDYMPFEGEEYFDKESQSPTPRNSSMYYLGLVEVLDPALGKRLRAAKPDREWFANFWNDWVDAGKAKPGESSASDAT